MAGRGLILRSLLASAALLAAYSAVISLGATVRGPDESQKSGNIAAAEGFLYGESTPDVVIVGSSLAYRLRPDMFDGRVYILAFGGRSVFDGLRILERTDRVPRLVLVETNVLDRPGDPAFTDALFTPGLFELKGDLPALQERHKPLHDLWLGVRGGLRWAWGALVGPAAGAIGSAQAAAAAGGPGATPGPPTNALFERMVAESVARATVVPGPEETAGVVGRLRRLADALRDRGGTVVLFEMPVHPRLCASPAYVQMRRSLAEGLPDYPRMPPPDCSSYRTTDGAHLYLDDARRFASELTSQLRRVGLWDE